MKILDTNVVLRYLLNDVPDMCELANEHIKEGNCIVYPEVLAEVVYVLTSVYETERKDVAQSIACFLGEVICEKEEGIRQGLHLFSETKLDFVDCLLIAYRICYKHEVITFDKKMLKRLKSEL